jgi:DNA-binding GntR family transcriptional regulator
VYFVDNPLLVLRLSALAAREVDENIQTTRSGMDRIEVSNDELKTVRDAMRELNRLVDALESGDSEKFVLCQNNRMRAVVISLDTFSQMRVPQPA